MTSSYKVDGVSQLTLKNGDLTILMEVEDFVIDVQEEYGYENYWMDSSKIYKQSETYAIRGTLSLDENGHAFVVHTKKKTVVRTARIEVARWDVQCVKEAHKAVGAPEDAIPSWVREDGKNYAEFKWEELV